VRSHTSTLDRPEQEAIAPPDPPARIDAVPPVLVVDHGPEATSVWHRPVVWGPIVGGLLLVIVAVVMLVGGGGDDDPAPKPKGESGPELAVARTANDKAWAVTWTHDDPVRQLWVLTASQPPQDGTTLVRGTRAVIPVALLDEAGGCFAVSTAAPASASSTTATTEADGGLTPLTTVPAETTPVDLKGFDVICTRGLTLDAVRR
jgi:hypothetical protein